MFKIIKKMFSKLKFTKRKRIVFLSFYGNDYNDNPKYITEEIIKQNLPYDLVWFVKKGLNKKDFPKQVRVEKYSIKKLLKEFSVSDVWINNCRSINLIKNGLKKKDNQIYIQTWHGSVGFKKIEKDIEHNEKYVDYLKFAQEDSKMIDYLLSPSRFDTDCLKECFYYNGSILEFGYPRNDLFFLSDDKKKNIKNKVRTFYNIPEDKKVVLYVPTFRDSRDLKSYKINVNNLVSTLNKKFGFDWVFLVRLHPNLIVQSDELSDLLFDAINVTKYPDTQELLLLSDVLITDYSSIIWDFCLQKKPAFIYATDIDEYIKERDFYIPLKEMPFLIAQNNEELMTGIINFDMSEYVSKQDEFMRNIKGHYDSGMAAKKLVEVIKTCLKDSEMCSE